MDINEIRVLFIAVGAGDLSSVKKFIENGGDVNTIGPDDFSLLDKAIIHNRIDIVEYLLSFDNINYEESIFIAIGHNRHEITELLLQKGIDINKKNEVGTTLLYMTVIQGNIKILTLLLEYNPNHDDALRINEKNHMGLTALHRAVINNDIEITRILLDHRADPLITTNTGKTVIYFAKDDNMKKLINSYS